MKKLLTVFGIVVICGCLFSGCGKNKLPDLPENAAAFRMGTFTDSANDNASYGTIEYENRTYIMYGTVNNSYDQSCVEACVGYIVKDGSSSSYTDPENKDRRVYTISGDPEHNFLLDYDSTVKLMNQPDIFRAVDTRGEDIEVPSYIDSFAYEFWE